MNQAKRPRGYLLGLILMAVVAIRAIPFYQGQPSLFLVVVFLPASALLYISEPWLSNRFPA